MEEENENFTEEDLLGALLKAKPTGYGKGKQWRPTDSSAVQNNQERSTVKPPFQVGVTRSNNAQFY